MTITPARLKHVLKQLKSGEINSGDVELILRAKDSRSVDKVAALRALCSVSSLRKDFDLWHRAIVAFNGDKNIAKLKRKGVLEAVVAFGHPAVRSQ